MEPIRSGFLSSEFYVTAAIIGLAAAFALPADAKWQVRLGAFFGAVASAIAYKWARTSQKGAAAELHAAKIEAGGVADALGGGIEAAPKDGPKVVGFVPRGLVRLRVLLTILAFATLALGATGCAAWRESGRTFVSSVVGCATDAAIHAVGPLATTLVETALHSPETDWPAELALLKTQAGEFKDCVILAALNMLGNPARADQPPPAVIGFRHIEGGTTASAGGGYASGVLIGSTHAEGQVLTAQMRLRAALR